MGSKKTSSFFQKIHSQNKWAFCISIKFDICFCLGIPVSDFISFLPYMNQNIPTHTNIKLYISSIFKNLVIYVINLRKFEVLLPREVWESVDLLQIKRSHTWAQIFKLITPHTHSFLRDWLCITIHVVMLFRAWTTWSMTIASISGSSQLIGLTSL